MASQSHTDAVRHAASERMPRGARFAVLGVAGALLLGALYLIAARGEAILLGIQSIGRFFCI